MTQQVRDSYRDHRKATWALVLGVVAAIATVVIPFASGGRPATDTFTGSVTVCTGTTQATFTVTLTNTSKTQNLGSADLYAPVNLEVTDANITSGGGTGSIRKPIDTVLLSDERRSLVHLRNLQLPGGAAVTIEVTATVKDPPGGEQYWYSLAKQSNDFNPGDLDLSNSFTNTSGDPYFKVSTCTLAFVTQPPSPWQKGSTAGDQGASPVAVSLYAGGVPQNVTGLTAPTLTSTPSAPSGGSPYFAFGSASVASDGLSWTYPDAEPTTAAPSGLYTLTATRGGATAPSQQFRVTTAICPPTCDVTSNLGGPESQVGITNTLGSSIAIDFASGSEGSEARCDPWNRAYIGSGENKVYLPGVVLDFAWQVDGMLKVVYRVRNSEWTLTNVARGNNDIEFCAGARHGVRTNENNYPSLGGVPFTGKNGVAATWSPNDGLFWGILASVPNAAKVKTDPAVCARGTQDLRTGLGGTFETWRTWTICIPYDWDWKNFG